MANLDALDLFSRALHTGAYGNAVIHDGTCTSVAATANGDILRVMRIPAGTRIQEISLQNDQLDSNGSPTVTAKVGYTPINATDGPAAVDNYWFATAALLRTKTNQIFSAQPITFQFDVLAIITLTAAIATLVVGANISLIGKGIVVGTR